MPGPEFNPADDELIDREEYEKAMAEPRCENCGHPLSSHNDVGCTENECECFFPGVGKSKEEAAR
jgi:hypothetical protein